MVWGSRSAHANAENVLMFVTVIYSIGVRYRVLVSVLVLVLVLQ